ncbi:hypothetical protein PN499_16630 [Kamptonema animale CS-326]|nr:hypothetical protein [Kamptonema animale]MDB9512816.1 hypothetical protein [Kamptonema animale CS-326]
MNLRLAIASPLHPTPPGFVGVATDSIRPVLVSISVILLAIAGAKG